MDAFFTMLSNVLIFIALAIPGYILAKTGLVCDKESTPLSRILIYVGVPFMVASNLIDITFDSHALQIVLLSIVIGILYTIACYFFSKPATSYIKDLKTQGVARFEIFAGNNGFLGIPLAAAVFSDMPLVVTGVIIVNIINNVSMYTIGIYSISGDKKNISLKKLVTNPCLIGFAVGLILNFTNVSSVLPQVSDYLSRSQAIVTPISMIIIGIKLGSIKLSSIFKNQHC